MYTAIIGAKWRFSGMKDYNEITAIWKNAKVYMPHVDAFYKLCQLDRYEMLHPLYPASLVFPLIMRILAHKKAPLTIFKTLNTRLQVYCYKPINHQSIMQIKCKTNELRIMRKGIELDLKTKIFVDDECVWECLHTFYYRGLYASSKPEKNTLPVLKDISNAPDICTWYLPENIGRRFVSVSGDSNGLHWSKLYAKIYGFKRDFAQPLHILPFALDQVLNFYDTPLKKIDIQFKGPVYYNHYVRVNGVQNDEQIRFNIYSEGNNKPCMVALLE
jgi:hypothetical protein